MSDNKSLVVEILSNVFEISEQKTESGKYKVTGIKTSYKSNNRKVTAIGNIAVIDITVQDTVSEEYIDPNSVEYNPEDFEFPTNIDVTKIDHKFIITGLDPRMYSVDNKCVVGCSPETYYPTLRHYGVHGFSGNHRFMVKLPKDEVKHIDDFNPVFSDLTRAVEFRNELYKQNKHKYKDFLKNDITIHYFDAMSDGIDNKDLIEFDHLLSFIKINKNTLSLPLDIGNYESYHNGIWLHPEGKNNGIVDSPDRYYHKELYEIDGKIYQADFLTIKRDKNIIPRGLLLSFLKSNKHIAKVKDDKCLFIDSLVSDFIKFIRGFVGNRNLAEKAFKIQDMLRDSALSNKMIAYHLNLGIDDIVNEYSAITLLDNDNRDDNDGFYLVPNRMSSYIRPMLPSRGNNDRQVGKIFEANEIIYLPKGEYVLFKNVYFKRTLAMVGSSYTYKYYPLELLIKYSDIKKYLAEDSEDREIVFPDNKLVYCDKTCGIEIPMFNYNTVDEILSYTDIVIDTELNFVDDCVYKIAEGIYGRADTRYKFTDSDFTDNPLEPFYEYLPN